MSRKQSVTAIVAIALAVATAACGKEDGSAVGVLESPSANPPGAPEAQATAEVSTTPTGVVRFEVTGSGVAYSVDWDPGEQGVADRQTSVALPWSAEFADPGDVEVYQLVIVGGENVACRILIDGREVVSEPPGGTSHCTYTP